MGLPTEPEFRWNSHRSITFNVFVWHIWKHLNGVEAPLGSQRSPDTHPLCKVGSGWIKQVTRFHLDSIYFSPIPSAYLSHV
ncbi:hypothetical protein Taro_031023 [Colocasia esculenta]|uniref:Uncharacterized protein n=1 Tax=Colocasia esculenta TaxID=4460 RepID=A0A843W551_COLES|nr:hypothetical protein [Colocasia esculenta]